MHPKSWILFCAVFTVCTGLAEEPDLIAVIVKIKHLSKSLLKGNEAQVGGLFLYEVENDIPFFNPSPATDNGKLLITNDNFAPELSLLNNYLVAKPMPYSNPANPKQKLLHTEGFVLKNNGEKVLEEYRKHNGRAATHAVVYTHFVPCSYCADHVVNFKQRHPYLDITLAYTASYDRKTNEKNLKKFDDANIHRMHIPCDIQEKRKKRSAGIPVCHCLQTPPKSCSLKQVSACGHRGALCTTTVGNSMCRDDHYCGLHGESYSWCYIDDEDNWDYCCLGSCKMDSQKDAMMCYAGQATDLPETAIYTNCGDAGTQTVTGENCDASQPCGTHNGTDYYWCYTQSGLGWDYCCRPDQVCGTPPSHWVPQVVEYRRFPSWPCRFCCLELVGHAHGESLWTGGGWGSPKQTRWLPGASCTRRRTGAPTARRILRRARPPSPYNREGSVAAQPAADSAQCLKNHTMQSIMVALGVLLIALLMVVVTLVVLFCRRRRCGDEGKRVDDGLSMRSSVQKLGPGHLTKYRG